MRYPRSVRIARQSVTVCIGAEKLNEDGELVCAEPKALKCNLQLKAFEKLTADKRMITLSGKALFDGDIFPEQVTISDGTLTYKDRTFDIYAGQKNYNPDGTVNYTTLELI